MKKISFLLIILFLVSTNIFGQTEKLNAIFDQYQDKTGVTSIKIAKPMFKMLGSLKIDNDGLGQIQPLLNKVNGLKMLVFEKPTFPKDLAHENVVPLQNYENLKKDVLSSVKGLKYEELMTVNSKDNKIKFLAQNTNSDILDNLILNIVSEDNMVLMLLDGKISMSDVSGLIEQTQNVSTVNPATIINSTSNLSSERKVSSFSGVEVSSGIDIEFTQNPTQSVVVKVDQSKQQFVITEVEGGVLKVFIRNNGVRNLSLNNLKVYVKSPNLNSVSTKGGSNFITINPVKTSNLVLSSTSGSRLLGNFDVSTNTAIQVSSGANVKLDLKTNSISASTTSGSSLKILGNGDSGTFSATSGSSISAVDFVVKSAVAEASSGANIKLNTTDSIVASASSAASIQYKGNPGKVTSSAKEITGASISKIN